MYWTDVPHGVISGAEQRFWVALETHADRVASRINHDPAFAKKLAIFAAFHDFELSRSQNVAKEIMGKNYFGIVEAATHFNVMPEALQLAVLGKVPFSEAILESCKDTHVLVAQFPLSIADIAKTVSNAHELFQYQEWYKDCRFITEPGYTEWHLIKKTPVDNSTNETFDYQKELLDTNSEVPRATMMVYTIIGHYKATGERLFETLQVRCSDSIEQTSYAVNSKNGIYLGNFVVSGGLHINRCDLMLRNRSLGLAAERRIED